MARVLPFVAAAAFGISRDTQPAQHVRVNLNVFMNDAAVVALLLPEKMAFLTDLAHTWALDARERMQDAQQMV